MIQPTTKRAILPSAGLGFKRATPHRYVYSKREIIEARGHKPDEGIGHYFACDETLAVRRWGFDAITGSKPEYDDENEATP